MVFAGRASVSSLDVRLSISLSPLARNRSTSDMERTHVLDASLPVMRSRWPYHMSFKTIIWHSGMESLDRRTYITALQLRLIQLGLSSFGKYVIVSP